MTRTLAGPPGLDPRMAAFLNKDHVEIFHSVAAPSAIWQADPYDVESIHADARAAYEALLHRATRTPAPTSGATLVVLGDSGSGKTHLMRAFRTRTHRHGWGYCGYMQMTTEADNYARYVLNNLIDSLQHPYSPDDPSAAGLTRLATGLLDAVPTLKPEDRDTFRYSETLTRNDLAPLVRDYADRLQSLPAFRACDLVLLRVLLFLQANDPRIGSRALMWLRCEEMTPDDRAWIGDAVPRCESAAPLRMLQQLAKVVEAVHHVPLVLLVDQVEDINTQSDADQRFIKLIDTLLAYTDSTPNGIVVLAGLQDYYRRLRTLLNNSKVDRLEHDPPLQTINHLRSSEEAAAIIAKRLAQLYDVANVEANDADELFPYNMALIEQMPRMRTRNLLQLLKQHHESCILAGAWQELGNIEPPPPPSVTVAPLDALWNTYHSTFQAKLPDDEEALASLLQQTIMHVSDELTNGYTLGGTTEGRYVEVNTQNAQNSINKLLVAICNGNSRGKGLKDQVADVKRRKGTFPVALVRTTDFPNGTASQIAKDIAELLKSDGSRRVVVQDAEWRRMLAFAAFRKEHSQRPDFVPWQRETKPLSELESLQRILDLERIAKLVPAPVAPPVPPVPPVTKKVEPVVPPPHPPTPTRTTFRFGMTEGLTPTPVQLDPKEFTCHAAFLGGAGSGKTTAALNLIEQALNMGIPAVLIDRKGDLCRYADERAWERPINDDRQATRARLRAMLDVCVYTPGEASGRHLSLPIVPPGFVDLPQSERERFAQWAAVGLSSMMGLRDRNATDQGMRAILSKAIETLALVPNMNVTLETLSEMITSQDDALLNAIGGAYPARYFTSLGERMLTLQLNNGGLLRGDEAVDIDAHFGTGPHKQAGRVRLSIISTRYLGDTTRIDFWVSQFLVALARWCAKAPNNDLQAIVMFDEADMYLPASNKKQPASKAPMEDLLRRARSAGVGIFLATQSPGDFDYSCKENVRTWAVGRIRENRSLEKLKPLFAESKGNPLDKLSGQDTGHFYLVREAGIAAVRSDESLMRTEQLGEGEIVELARNGSKKAAPVAKKAVVV